MSALTHPFDRLALPNGAQLIFTPCPGTKNTDVGTALATLQGAGARHLITLMPSEELAAFNADAIAALCPALGLNWWHLPVEDDCAPAAPFARAWPQHKGALLAALAAGDTVAIHCRGGSGRTGLLAALLLLEAGYAWPEVKGWIQGLRPRSLTLPEHCEYLAAQYAHVS
ncbi:MAG: tyrosine-protein phosphatase [Aeromonas sp.]